MSEMIERVARVIGESYDGYADPVDTPNNWARAVEAARAAIEAMREPTHDMLDAGDAAYDGLTERVWDAMIDAALTRQATSSPASEQPTTQPGPASPPPQGRR